MKQRLLIGIALAALFIAALALGAVAQVVLFGIAAVLAVYEMGKALLEKGFHVFLAPSYAFAALLAPLLWWDVMPVAFLWMAAAIAVLIERVCNGGRRTEECFLGLLPLGYPLPFFAALVLVCVRLGAQTGTTAVLALFACPLIGDSLAYFIGSALGKHKLCPAISPKKSVEGAVASLCGSVLAGAAVYMLQGIWGGGVSLAILLALGLLCGVLGQLGDLCASVIKRWAGIKDYGRIFPGHGGVLDRLDSVLFCAPAIYACFYFL